MAGGKLPPRQKMIGMMYLVLTALLAMNVSKDILDAFIIVNDGLEKTAANFKDKIDAQHAAFDAAYFENKVKVGPYYEKAKRVEELSDELYDYIMMMKANVIFQTEKLESIEQAMAKDANGMDTTINLANIASKDNYDIPTTVLIGSEPAQPKEGEYTARELHNKMEAYKTELLTFVKEGSSLEHSINATFSFEDKKDASGTVNNWESYNFYHTPIAATLTILSKMQTDIRNAESDIVKQLFANVDASSFKFNVVDAAIIPKSNYVTLGDTFEASIFVAAYDDTKNPIIKVGTTVDSATGEVTGDTAHVVVRAGKGTLKIKTTKEGEYTWQGAIKMKSPSGDWQAYPFMTTYNVAKPSLVVAATKMNVFYKGLDNPVSISVPGYPADKIKASISTGSIRPDPKSGKGHFIVNAKKGVKATISVSVQQEDGSMKRMGQGEEFRLKNLPDPVPSIAGKRGSFPLSKARLSAVSTVKADMGEGFDFDLPVQVKSFVFTTTVSGALIEKKVRGNKIPADVVNIIKKSKRNTKVYFEEIVVPLPDGTERTLGPVAIKLQ